MGMGFWLYEDIKYDPVTGKNLTRGTWEYKVNQYFINYSFNKIINFIFINKVPSTKGF
jgi:hypothetical protein